MDLQRVHGIRPGQYARGRDRAVVACPCCTHVSELDWPYQISEQGVVAPEWRCTGCGWADAIVLTDWAEKVLR
jgi:hypothetical protein